MSDEAIEDMIQWLEREAKWHFTSYGKGNFMGKGLQKAADTIRALREELKKHEVR